MLREAYLESNGKVYYQYDFENSTPNENMRPFLNNSGFAKTEGIIIHDVFKDYFANVGAVPWQNM